MTGLHRVARAAIILLAALAAAVLGAGPSRAGTVTAPVAGPVQLNHGKPGGAAVRSAGQGSLNIVKSVGYTAGLPVPPNFPSFAMTVSCTPGGPTNQAVTVPTTAGGLTLNGIADGASCTVTEPPLPPIAHAPGCNNGPAHWVQDPPVTGNITANTTTRVTLGNWIACGVPTGWIAVSKTLVNQTAAATPTSFPATAHCTGNLTNPVPLTVTNTVSFGADAGSVCSVSETPPASIPHAPGCQGADAVWTTTYTPSQVVADPAVVKTIRVTNTLACDKTQPTGRLTVFKQVVNATGGPAPIPASFAMTAHCSPSGPLSAPLHVGANQAVSLAAPIAVGSTCSVAEAHLPDIPGLRACLGAPATWTTRYSGPVVIPASGPATETVTNTLACGKVVPTGTLTLIKQVVSEGAIAPPATTFVFDIACPPSGPNTSVTLSSANGFQQTLQGVANPAACTVTETPPATPPDLAKLGCRWETEAPSGGGKTNAPIAPNSTRVLVNHWVCKPGTGVKGADLVIRKTGGGTVSLGGTATFVLTVANNGPGSVGPGGAVVTDPLPAGFSLATATGPGWTCVGQTTITCTYGGSTVGPNSALPPITVVLSAKSVGGAENCATVQGPAGTDTVPGNDRACAGVTVQRGPTPAGIGGPPPRPDKGR